MLRHDRSAIDPATGLTGIGVIVLAAAGSAAVGVLLAVVMPLVVR